MDDVTLYVPQESVLPQGTTDDQLIAMWLHDKAEATQEAYTFDIGQFREFIGKSVQKITLADVQVYADALKSLPLEPATVARKLKSVKSLLTFAQKTGYIPYNVGTMVKLPKVKKTLAERILTEEQVFTMIAKEPNKRNHALLRVLYVSAIRVSELCDLCWKDVRPHGDTGQITVFGKGDETRAILLKADTYQELIKLRGKALPDTPVFRSRGGGRGKAGDPLDPSQVLRIVRDAARRAGIQEDVSPHWLRHAHASHALENGASIILVKETLGHKDIETTAGYTHVRPGASSAQYLKI
jgi:site-specific recombinase XerD